MGAGISRWGASSLAGALAVAILVVPASAPAATGFGQIQGPGGCLLESGATASAECAAGVGISRPEAVAVSPDGANVYVVGGVAGGNVAQSFGSIAILKRNPATGEISPEGCLSSDGTDGRDGASGICTQMPSLLGADGVTVSADGRSVYVSASSSGSVAAFARDQATGALTRLGCFQKAPPAGSPCTPANIFGGTDDLLTNAADSALYAASPLEGTISAFIAPSPGPSEASKGAESPSAPPLTVSSLFSALPGTFTANPCVAVNGYDGSCANGVAMKGAGALTLSPEGNELYAVAPGSGAIDTFTTGAQGPVQSGCLMASPPPGMCTASRFLQAPSEMAISPNGKIAYIADRDSLGGRIDLLARNAANGQLSDVGCVDYLPLPEKPEPEEGEEHGGEQKEEEEEASKEPPDPCTQVPGLESVQAVATSADGSELYAFGSSSAVSFSIDPSTGALTELACGSDSDTRCAALPDLSGVQAAAVSPDGRNVYVVTANSKAVLAFGIGASVTGTTARLTKGGLAFVNLACPARLGRACRGRVTLTRSVARYTRRHRHRARAFRLTLGSSSLFTVGAGRDARIAVRVAGAAHGLMRSRRPLRVTAVVQAQRFAGGSGFGRTLLLRLARR
jgi:DNA-binding beta-propeller fold protein YncE